MNIPMTPVASSQIHAIGHDPATNTLAIQFKGKDGGAGSIYHYENVTPHQHAEFMAATSIGAHFGQHFKKNAAHPYTRQK